MTEGFIDVTAGVKSVIDDTVERMRKAGAVVEEISIPEQKSGMNELMTDAKSRVVPPIKQITQKKLFIRSNKESTEGFSRVLSSKMAFCA